MGNTSIVRQNAQLLAAQIAKRCNDDFFTTFTTARWPSAKDGLCRLLVLDSSFNPPTKAHAALLTTAISQYPPDHFDASLLLFSLRNVDKKLTGSTSLQRAQMMELMARQLQTKESQALRTIAVGLTSHGRFVDKAVHINKYFQQHFPTLQLEMYFLMGYDTVTRLFNPMYYSETLEMALDPFFKQCYLVCADRGGFDSSEVEEFWAGPVKAYADKIKRVSLGESLASLSSTAARSAVKNDQNLDNLLDKDILDFIHEEQIYL
ncbi:hypothetical protein EC973_006747 [Apophysomyces ossiformis]|uniref:Cytidyltransferase-like domain-containing protein n=1 Tax=Apophysomyces ossiformis TaxID=679940 RepID=A0A8H7EQ81_9FUNG|nr:hypothetical protein EC973_006747 [Apophysomyces ossiformis]